MRAFVKGAGLWLLGRLPGGPTLYRKATREWAGTQATHVDKLARVTPGYDSLFSSLGFKWEGKQVAILDPGLTTFWPMACWLLTGVPSEHLQHDGHFLDQYVSRSAGGVVASLGATHSLRLNDIEALRWAKDSDSVLDKCQAREHRHTDVSNLPLEGESLDLLHSGGTLEHFKRPALEGYIAEATRVLRPGAIYSAVHDHRDHLYHADKSLEPMNHLRHGELAYRFLFGHKLTYHNRLSPTEVIAILENSGLQKVAVRRMVLPEQCYVSDEEVLKSNPGCTRLARMHRSMNDIDLRTAACHYVFRKVQ